MSDTENATTSRVTDKGQTTIPMGLRKKYGIQPGDTVIWEDTADGIVVRKVIGDDGRGMLVDDELGRSEREEIADALAEELHERRETEWAVE